MKDNNTTATPEAWKMRFLANGTSGTWFYTEDIAVTDAWLRAHPDDIEELRAALARMLHMHHMMLETTHYRENITDARCIREMHEAPLQALNILARYPHKKDEV